jgi:hypothetical protein
MKSPASVFSLPRHAVQAMLEALLVATLVLGLVAVVSPHLSLAARSTGPTMQATLTTGAAATTSGSFDVDGWGFPKSSLVNISMANPGCCVGFAVASDSTGSFHFTVPTDGAGYYVINAVADQKGKIKVIASANLTIP